MSQEYFMQGYWAKPDGLGPAGVGSAEMVLNQEREGGMLVNGSKHGRQ